MNQTTDKKPIKRSTQLLSIAFLFVLMGVTFWLVLKDQSIGDIWAAIQSADGGMLLIGAVCAILFLLFQALALYIPIRYFYNGASLLRSIGYSFVGFFYSSITPSATGGQPLQFYYMCRDGIAISYTSLTLLISNIAYQLVLVIYALLMLALRFNLIMDNLSGFSWLLLFGLLVCTALVAGIAFLMFSRKFVRRAVNGCIRFLHRIHLLKNPEKSFASAEVQMEKYQSGAQLLLRHRWVFINVFIATALQMTALYIIPYFVYLAFGLQGYSALDVIALQAVMYVAVGFLPLPGAVGASETAFSALFRLIFSEVLIVPAMLLSRGLSFYFILILSAIVSGIIHLCRPKRRPEEVNLSDDK